MAITSLQRSSGTQPSVVHMVADDSYKTVIGSTYIADQEENIKSANRGEFTWNDGDQVLAELPSGNYNLTVNVALDQSVTLEEPPEREQVNIVTRVSNSSYILDANSADLQIFVGSESDDKVLLPDLSTLVVGRQFDLIVSGALTSLSVRTSDDDELIKIGYNGQPLRVTCVPESDSSSATRNWALSPSNSARYEFDPEITFDTEGDLSVSYGFSTAGVLQRVGSWMKIDILLDFNPTYTTSSGDLIITGLPLESDSNFYGYGGILEMNGSTTGFATADPFSFPTGCTYVVPFIDPDSGLATIKLRGIGSNQANTNLSTTEFTSGDDYVFKISIVSNALANDVF